MLMKLVQLEGAHPLEKPKWEGNYLFPRQLFKVRAEAVGSEVSWGSLLGGGILVPPQLCFVLCPWVAHAGVGETLTAPHLPNPVGGGRSALSGGGPLPAPLPVPGVPGT